MKNLLKSSLPAPMQPARSTFHAGKLRTIWLSVWLLASIFPTNLPAGQTQTVASLTPPTNAGTSGAAVIRRSATPEQLILIGFLGGNIKGSDLLRKETQIVKQVQQNYPHTVHAAMFANRDGRQALKTILQLLGADQDGRLTDQEKRAARIVIFGHSWGASETVNLADQLNALHIPVLLTVQVDSVQKFGENDRQIPPNVAEAANFYQSEGLLRGRNPIVAVDPKQTTILGNYQSSYRNTPVSVAGFPWYARAFMRQHIEIENDSAVWNKVEALIQKKIDDKSL